MKQIQFSALLMLSFSITATAQMTVHRPRYLVENQLIPYVIKLQGDFSILDSYMKTESENYNFRQNSQTVDSYLLPIIATPRNLIIFGGGYMGDQLKTEEPDANNIKYNGLYVNLFATGSVGERVFWITYQSVGTFSDNMFDSIRDNLKYYQFSKIGYKWNENLSTSAGVLYISNFNEPVIVPLLEITYSFQKFIVKAELPVKIEVEYLINNKLRILAEGGLSARAYFNKKAANTYTFSENKAMLGIKYNVLKYTWAFVGVTKMFDNQYKWQKPEIMQGTLKDDIRLSFGLALHVD